MYNNYVWLIQNQKEYSILSKQVRNLMSIVHQCCIRRGSISSYFETAFTSIDLKTNSFCCYYLPTRDLLLAPVASDLQLYSFDIKPNCPIYCVLGTMSHCKIYEKRLASYFPYCPLIITIKCLCIYHYSSPLILDKQ